MHCLVLGCLVPNSVSKPTGPGSRWALISLRLHDHFSRRRALLLHGSFGAQSFLSLGSSKPHCQSQLGPSHSSPYTMDDTLTCSLITEQPGSICNPVKFFSL